MDQKSTNYLTQTVIFTQVLLYLVENLHECVFEKAIYMFLFSKLYF